MLILCDTIKEINYCTFINKKSLGRVAGVTDMAEIKKRKEIDCESKKKYSILYVTSECMPFASSGGLGEVAGSLPAALNKLYDRQINCRVIMPLYEKISKSYIDKMIFLGSCQINECFKEKYVGLYSLKIGGTIYYFLDNEYYFKRDSLYGYYDDGERFSFFSRAVFAAMDIANFHPDIIHCNDWQTALVPVYQNSLLKKKFTKTVFTIHNMEYQGKFNMDFFDSCICLPVEDKYLLEYGDCLNLMKAGIECSNICNTVSPTYAKELQDPTYSFGMDLIISRNSWKIRGILNGINIDVYNPETDVLIPFNYSSNDLSGKKKCKEKLQCDLSLPKKDVPIITLISRLVPAKGMDLILHSLEKIIVENDVQFIMLGTGFQEYEYFFKSLEDKYPEKVVSMLEFSTAKSHLVYSAGDILLMPSKSEPCGLSQMIGCLYGDVPVVRETGGLKDSIKDCTLGEGNGFTFADYGTEGFVNSINNAIELYGNKVQWEKLVKHDLKEDFSWDKAAKEYKSMYESLFC